MPCAVLYYELDYHLFSPCPNSSTKHKFSYMCCYYCDISWGSGVIKCLFLAYKCDLKNIEDCFNLRPKGSGIELVLVIERD